MTDIVTFGETMLRYAPPSGERLENAEAFGVTVGGAESNVAVAAARLGRETAWLSKLPDSPLGRRIARTLRGQGVSPAVVWSDEGRQGVYYVEPGGSPRGSRAIYDRADAAVTTATPDELATDRITAADCFYTSGITPALSPTLADTTTTLLELARDAGTTTVFDVNYRSKLWEPRDARETLEELLGMVDLLFLAKRDAATVFDRNGDAESIATWARERFGAEVVCVTRGVDGVLAVTDAGVHEQATFPADTHDPVGTGDAQVGGFLAHWLEHDDVAGALEYGAATAALKRTIQGDMALVSPAEVEAVIDGEHGMSR